MTGSSLSARLERCIAAISVERHAREISERCGLPEESCRPLLDTYCNEARVGLALVEPSLKPGLRVLEIGTGIGLLASVLKQHGVDIVGIEPGAAGFGFMPTLASIVKDCVASERPFIPMPIGVAELTPETHGTFDLIYSVNVLEHLIELDTAIAAMTGVLSAGGRMVHMCPNYTVPYEPHLMIPLLPGVPHLTRHLFAGRVRRYPGLWEDLNFITAGRVRRLARQNGLAVQFDPKIMGTLIRRIAMDPILAARQGRWVRTAAAMIQKSGALALVDRIPAGCSTPMIARFEKG